MEMWQPARDTVEGEREVAELGGVQRGGLDVASAPGTARWLLNIAGPRQVNKPLPSL